ncbi:MAG: hypothetical protein HKN75_07050 [Bacteroidia bacterium]|nr:hypothetical protein [Bacteroidia bacterium]
MKILSTILLVAALFVACSSPSTENSSANTEKEIKEVEALENAVQDDLKETEQINKELDSLLNTL